MNASVFWDRVDRSAGAAACWPWTGASINDGYGQLRIGRQRILAHRLAYTLAVADIPAGLCVLHSCDNPICCNPRHLRIGSQHDNQLDAMSRGRWDYRRRFTQDQVRQIRAAVDAGATIKQLAAAYRVHYATIHGIIHGDTYRQEVPA